jgi:hypothetical protein
MLRTVAALREVLITTYVSTLAGLTTFARLGMAPSWRSTTWAGHLDEAGEVEIEGDEA